MAHFKIHGYAPVLSPVRAEMSDVIHECAVEVLELPADKRFHRFFPMTREDFIHPDGRGDRYTIIEILMFEGRSTATKKVFYQRLYQLFEERLQISPQDLEIILVETPRHDWGIRGKPGDELSLNYRVEV